MTRTTPELSIPFPNFRTTPAGRRLIPCHCNRLTYMADIQWNRVSNLELSGSKVETLPLGHRGLNFSVKSSEFTHGAPHNASSFSFVL
ncbi:hypothetical protein AVEN_32286-1, partial [Araneus ventricosus]